MSVAKSKTTLQAILNLVSCVQDEDYMKSVIFCIIQMKGEKHLVGWCTRWEGHQPFTFTMPLGGRRVRHEIQDSLRHVVRSFLRFIR